MPPRSQRQGRGRALGAQIDRATRLGWRLSLAALPTGLALAAGLAWGQPAAPKVQQNPRPAAEFPVRALHLIAPRHSRVPLTRRLCLDHLPKVAINTLILEVNYAFQYRSHPEVSDGDLTADDVRSLVADCRSAGIRVVPLLQMLGHQGWQRRRFALLKKYPHFDELPLAAGVESRTWCSAEPAVWALALDLADELLQVFGTQGLHIGLDEIKAIGRCPRCKGRTAGELFADSVVALHNHIVGKRGAQMMMWGDRLLDGKALKLNRYESSHNGTHVVGGRLPKEVTVCDWHYAERSTYPSIQALQDLGVGIWVATWKRPRAAVAIAKAAKPYIRAPGAGQGGVTGILHSCWTCGDGGGLLLRAFEGRRPRNGWDRDAMGVLQALRATMSADDG